MNLVQPITLYEDDGGTYRHEDVEHAPVALAWEDGRQTLRIGARVGRFAGMTAQRMLRIRLMAAAPGGRIQEKTVRYAGAPVDVRFDRSTPLANRR